MKLATRTRSLAAMVFAGVAAPSVLAAQVSLNGHAFTLPDGFTVELAAGSDLVPRPIAGSYDPEGRLYVTDSSGSNLPPAEQLKDPRNRILRLTDLDGDGRFDKSEVYAEQVMFPQGCLWHGGSVYVAGPPSIWKFTDTDGDGRADRREEWYQGKVLTGCANDVHGPYLGPEGMLYWTKGAFGRLDLKDHRGRAIDDRCAHVFRAWPDGTGLEVVMSGGMDNPVEVAFTAEGEPVVISTFIDLSQPGRRDGLAHAVYGGVFGKINDVVDEPMVRRTGGLMPVLSQLGPAAACALWRYEGEAFGAEYRDNLFGTLFNLRKVTRHVLRPAGASYAADDSDFLVSDQIDFRPTDLVQDIDGSLLVVDTGGWYKLCCPSSQLAKADVLGAIYRVRRTDAKGDPGNATVASRPHGEARNAAYARLTRPPQLTEGSELVRVRRLAWKADPAQADELRTILDRHAPRASTSTDSARLTRLAAEGLGRMRDRQAVPLLLTALAQGAAADRFLEHSLLFALIEIGDVEALRPELTSGDPVRRRAALLVLEQGAGTSALRPAEVVDPLTASDKSLRETAHWVVRRHSEWGTEWAGHFRQHLASPQTTAADRVAWEGLLGLLAKQPESRPFLAEAVAGPSYREETRLAALQAMADSGARDLPDAWREAILTTLRWGNSEPEGSPARVARLSAGLRAARALPFPKEGDPELTGALQAIANHAGLPAAIRIEAMGGLPSGSAVSEEAFGVAHAGLQPDRPPSERLAAATALARLHLTLGQLERLADAVAAAGPLELQRELGAFARGGDEALGRRLLASLKASKSIRALRPEDVKPHLAKFPESIQREAEGWLASIQSDASQDRARLEAIAGEVLALQGRIREGQTIFNSTKAACSSCHRMGYLGGDLGPDLTSIGTARTERDLLEAVLFPSLSYVRSYEPWIAATKDGEEHSGVLRRDTPDEIVLATGPGAEVRIMRSDLVELRLGALSTMPAGLEEQLTRQELADLLAFLKNTKWGVN